MAQAGVENQSSLFAWERRVLLQLAHGLLGPLVPPPEDTRFLEAVSASVARLPLADRAAFHLLIAIHEVLPLFARSAPLSELPSTARDAWLQGLARARLAPLRRAAAVARTLVAFAYYGQEQAWPAIGYDGPWIGRIDVERLPDPEWTRSPDS